METFSKEEIEIIKKLAYNALAKGPGDTREIITWGPKPVSDKDASNLYVKLQQYFGGE